MNGKYKGWWKEALNDLDKVRLNFYRTVKNDFVEEEYLKLPHFNQRRTITKFKCSDHQLAIEKEHFLLDCKLYDQIKLKYNLRDIEIGIFFLLKIPILQHSPISY